jgi:nucleoside-diphosphate-sugar epimerase
MTGAEVVIHTALAPTSAPAVQEAVTIAGTQAVLDAAKANRVRRIVHVSTAAVHDWSLAGRFDETAPVSARDFYSRTKLAAEQLLLNQRDVPVTVIRPTCVYGPFSRTWTVSPIEFLRLGIPLVSTDNAPRANLIYVDNLADMIIAAAAARDDEHHVYIANDAAPTDWQTLFAAYAQTIGVPLFTYTPLSSPWALLREEISVSVANAKVITGRFLGGSKRPLLDYLASLHRHVPLVQRCRQYVPAGLQNRLVSARARGAAPAAAPAAPATASAPAPAPSMRPFASAMIRAQYGAKATFVADKARRELGWTPRIGGAEAVERTCAWIAFAGV